MISLKTSGAPTGRPKTSDDRAPLRLHGAVGLSLGVLGSALGTAVGLAFTGATPGVGWAVPRSSRRTEPISPSMQTACFEISAGQAA